MPTGYMIPPPPTIAANATVAAHTDSATLTVADAGKIHTNTGSSGTVTLTLPKASDAAGCSLRAQVTAAQIVHFLPVTGEAIFLGGDGVATKYLAIAGTIGNFCDIYSDGVQWLVTKYSGVVTKEA